MTSFTVSFVRAGFDAAVQGAVLLAAVALALHFARGRTSAAQRHLAWSLALAATVVVSLLSIAPPRWRIATARPESPASPALSSPSAPAAEARLPERVEHAIRSNEAATATADEPAPSSIAPRSFAPARSTRPSWQALVASLWLAGFLAALAPYFAALWRSRRLVRGARRLDPNAIDLLDARRVPVLASPRVAAPMTVGLARCAVLVPPDFERWPAARRREVLFHELAHVRRRDALTRLLARVAVALQWFDPLAWFAERRLRLESECACDDAVLAAGAGSSDYAESLVCVARALRGASAPPAAALAMAGGAELERRVRSILDAERGRRAPRRASIAVASVGALACALPLGALAIARELPQRASGEVLAVAADGSARFRSIQEAIDAAPEGATVRVAPGVYRERVLIAKPLTLEGAGWQATRIASDYTNPLAGDASKLAELQEMMNAGATPEEKSAIRAKYLREHGPQPTLQVLGARGVTVRGFALTQPGEAREGMIQPGAIVSLESCGAKVTDCAILGSPASGVTIAGDAEVELVRSLVAGVQATGIAISGPEPKVRVAECDLRRCNHRGITIGGNEHTTVERCRISGSAWHGIRYDGGAPQILGNLIFENERSGIYASGGTRAQVRGNLFFRNGMTGLSCWYRNQDEVEGNTFVADQRSALEVLGASRPSIRRNLFAALKQAVSLGNIGDDSPDAKTSGEVDLKENAFWKVDTVLAGPAAHPDVVELGGNRELDPRFVAPDRRDYALAGDSPARAAGIGAADPLGFESPWPLQPEEGAQISQRSDREEREAAMQATQAAYQAAKPWIDDLMQIQDPAKRDAAVAELRAALRSDDAVRRHAALIAFVQTRESNYERGSFRELVLPLCSSETGAAQVRAFYALASAGKRAGDERLLLEALGEPSAPLRASGTQLLMLYFDQRLEGEAGEAALKLLDGQGESWAREVLPGLWGATASPALQQRLLELAAKPDTHHDAIYFGLSTLQNKSRAVVELLLDACAGSDHEDAWRSMWGLGQGVETSEQPLVAERMLRLYEARNDARTRSKCIELVGRYGTSEQLPALRELAANEMLSDGQRAEAQRAIDAIGAR